MKRRFALWNYHNLDVQRMKEAAAYLIGEHDFKSFCSADSQVESTVRTIYDLTVTQNGEDIVISVCGNGFLYNMVRIIAGTLLEVGKGKIEPNQMPQILSEKNRQAAGPTAPAHGLTLVKYEFLEEGLC
jgi:tRNA pseudouridine38-40 synthase